MRLKIHQTIGKVTDDMSRRHTFNTAIAACMELLNELGRFADDSEQGRAVMQEALDAVVLMLSPIVPHISHALWQALGHDGLVVDASWPEVDEAALVQDRIELVVQVNGKLRGKIQVAADATKDSIEQSALNEDKVGRFIADLTVRKGASALTNQLQTLNLQGVNVFSGFGRQLADAIESNGVVLVQGNQKADMILKVSNPQRRRDVLSVDSSLHAREYSLVAEVVFQFADNLDALKQTESAQRLAVRRDLVVDAYDVLGSDYEAERLNNEMDQELAERLIFRLRSLPAKSRGDTTLEDVK
ncbi:unnamed protein product [Cyprideis torosa]|uniref:leucine--tRNA ligase n=1 Tax=Cyprideis torosa TaxID=163714 RepID=A0A7R8WZ40_9CRUS|nr:unnamed protein product [Cyprideis torosa]CAG0910187.1 unnamed protein product [Cyprideis torosa]